MHSFFDPLGLSVNSVVDVPFGYTSPAPEPTTTTDPPCNWAQCDGAAEDAPLAECNQFDTETLTWTHFGTFNCETCECDPRDGGASYPPLPADEDNGLVCTDEDGAVVANCIKAPMTIPDHAVTKYCDDPCGTWWGVPYDCDNCRCPSEEDCTTGPPTTPGPTPPPPTTSPPVTCPPCVVKHEQRPLLRAINARIGEPILKELTGGKAYFPYDGWTYLDIGEDGPTCQGGICDPWWPIFKPHWAMCCDWGSYPPPPSRKFCVYKNNGKRRRSPEYEEKLIRIIKPEVYLSDPNKVVLSGRPSQTAQYYRLVFPNAPTPVRYPGMAYISDIFQEEEYPLEPNVDGLIWWTQWPEHILNPTYYQEWWDVANERLDTQIAKWNEANPRYKCVECEGDDALKEPCDFWNCTNDPRHPVADCTLWDPKTNTISGKFVCDPTAYNYCQCEEPPKLPGPPLWLPDAKFPTDVPLI